jgi:hypothetical protein
MISTSARTNTLTIGQIAVDPETGEEREEYALYLCRRCADKS